MEKQRAKQHSLPALALALGLCVGGCSFTADDARDLEHASNQASAANNLRELMEYFRNGPRERITSAYAWRSGVALATTHGLAHLDPVLYDQFYATLAAGERDPELRAWKFYCLALLRDPRCVEILIRELGALQPASPNDWECAVNALYAIMEMPGLIEGNAAARMEFLQGLARLRTIATSVGTRQPTVATFLDYAQTFEERFKNPVTLSELLRRTEPSTPDESLLDTLRQANDLFIDAASPRPSGSYRRNELLALADAVGMLALRDGKAGQRAWVMLMEHAPVHGAEALLDHLDSHGGAQAAATGVTARRAVDALAVLRVLQDLSAAPTSPSFYATHASGRVLDPRERSRGFDAAQLMERLSRLSLGLLSHLKDGSQWLAAVQHLVRYELGLAVTQLVALEDGHIQEPSRARMYVQTMANLITEGGAGAETWRARAADRLPSIVRIAAHRVPAMVYAAVGSTHAAALAAELRRTLELRSSPASADQAMWDEWILTYCHVLGRQDGGQMGQAGAPARADYLSVSRHLVRCSVSVQLGTIEFIRRRDPNLAARAVLDARKSPSQGERALLNAALARLLSAREITDVATEQETVNEMLTLAATTREDDALVGARALAENAGQAAKEAVRRAVAAGTHSGRAVSLMFRKTVARWQGE